MALLLDRRTEARAALDEARLRMLIAETPVADRDVRRAVLGCRRVDARLEPVLATLESLRAERFRLRGGRG